MTKLRETVLKIINIFTTDCDVIDHRNQLSFLLKQDDLINICFELRDNEETKFDMLIDVTAIDWNKKPVRYEVVYFVYSTRFKRRIRLKVPVNAKNPSCPTVTKVWESANWYERETFDMYGIKFIDHPGLRRFYMPEDFVDPTSGEPLHPLRKDFPLTGIPNTLPLPPYPEKYGELN